MLQTFFGYKVDEVLVCASQHVRRLAMIKQTLQLSYAKCFATRIFAMLLSLDIILCSFYLWFTQSFPTCCVSLVTASPGSQPASLVAASHSLRSRVPSSESEPSFLMTTELFLLAQNPWRTFLTLTSCENLQECGPGFNNKTKVCYFTLTRQVYVP